MSGEKRHHVLDCYAKKWNPLFSNNKNTENDNPHFETTRKIDSDGDEWNIFLRDSEESGPSSLVEEILEFVKGSECDAKWEGERRDAWVDDRSSLVRTGAGVRIYGNPLTSPELERHLSVQRPSHSEMPDADRRLIYIRNLSPAYMLALFKTASTLQVSILRDAFWSHIASQISIRVKIPPKEFIFQLKLHLPYPTLRQFRPQREGNHKWQCQWMDLSFLKGSACDVESQDTYGVYQAHFSLILSGHSDRRWVAYSFDNNNIEDDEDEEDKNSKDDKCPLREDMMALDAEGYTDMPIFDPREYFLLTFRSQMDRILKEWTYLVRHIDRDVHAYRGQASFPLSYELGSAGYQPNDKKKTYDWTQRARGLLSQLINVLSATIKEWESFVAPDGDIGYFSGFDSSKATSQDSVYRHLCSIKEMFDELQSLRRKLTEVQDSCQKLTEDLKLRLILESNEATLQSNEAIRRANDAARQNRLTTKLAVWFISPLALTTAYFSMPRAVIPFPMNIESFFIAIIVVMVMMSLFLTIGSRLSVLDTKGQVASYSVKAKEIAKSMALERKIRTGDIESRLLGCSRTRDVFRSGNSDNTSTADSRSISPHDYGASKLATSSNCHNSEQRIWERMTDKWLAEQHHQQHRTQKGDPLPTGETSLVCHESILDQGAEMDTVGEPGYLHSTKSPGSDDTQFGELPALPLDMAISETDPNDGDFSTWSDFSEPEPELSKAFLEVLEPFRPRIVQALMTKFLARQQSIRAHSPSHQEDVTAASTRLLVESGLESSNSLASVGREARRGGEEDDGDNQQPSRNRVLRSSNDSSSQPRLACPFYKNNPLRHHKCFKHILRDISRVKQHLKRCHPEPIHCHRCFLIFETESNLRYHARSEQCPVVPPRQLEGINTDQKRQLAQRVSSQNSMEENWYMIYEIVFPGAERPQSPYLDLPPEILELEEIALREVPSMINELLVRSRIPANLQPHQYEIHALVRTVFEDGFELLLQRYASRSASSISRDSTSSTLSDRPNGYSSPDSGSGTSHRHNDASQIFRSSEAGSSSAVPEASNWAPEQFSQGLGVGTDADYSYPLNGFDIPMDWNFDESWHNSGTL